jgi:hypothetical protein
VPQVNTIPPVEQQNQGFIQEPVETVDFIPPAIIPETGIEL